MLRNQETSKCVVSFDFMLPTKVISRKTNERLLSGVYVHALLTDVFHKKVLEPPLKCNHFLRLAGWIKSWIILRWKMLFIFYSISHSEEGSLGLMNHVLLCKRYHALKPQGRIRFLITEVRFERFSVLGPASTLTEKSSKYCTFFIYYVFLLRGHMMLFKDPFVYLA